MAAPLSLTRATITTPDKEIANASLVIRQGHATVRQGRTLVAEVEVVTVEQQSSVLWLLTLVDGTQWSVQRRRGCGCSS